MQENVLRVDLSSLPQLTIENSGNSLHQTSIAVLSFTDRDEICKQQHIGRWISDDLTHFLSRFRYLSVVNRRTCEVVCRRHNETEAIGRALGTRYLATGSVSRLDDSLSVTARLIDAQSGKQFWCSTYEVNGHCLIDLEDDLAKKIATGLAVSIDARERKRVEQTSDNDCADPSATSLVLMADRLTKQFQQNANQRARQLVEDALHIDSSSARAFAVLSRTHHLDCRYGWTKNPDRSIEHAVAFAKKAIQLDTLEASGYAELGINQHFLKDYDAASASYRRALDINPNDPDILADYSDLLISNGEPEQAIESLTMAIHLCPDRAGMYRLYLACAFDVLGDDEMVIKVSSMIRGNREGHRMMAASYARLGMMDEASHHANLVMKVHPNFSLAHWRTVLPYRDPEIRARIVEGLERAGLH